MSRVKVTATISLSIILLSFNSWGRQLEPVAQPQQQEQQEQQQLEQEQEQQGRQLEPVTQPQQQEQQEQQQLEQEQQEQQQREQQQLEPVTQPQQQEQQEQQQQGRQLEPVAQPQQLEQQEQQQLEQEQEQQGRQLEPVAQPQQQEQQQQEQQQQEQVLQVLQVLQEQGQAEAVAEQVLDDKQQKPNFFQKIGAFFSGKKTTPSSGISIERHQGEVKDSLQTSAMDSLVSSIITSSLDEKPDSIAKARRDSIFFYELVNGIVNDEPLIDEVLEEAYKHIGKRYVYGSPGPDTFDCSGFTSYCYRKIGIELNRSSKDQALNGFPVSRDQLRKGDIIIFGSRRNPKTIGHVGMVVEYYPETGRFKFIHAASQGVEFQWSDHSYYSIRYLGARRIVD